MKFTLLIFALWFGSALQAAEPAGLKLVQTIPLPGVKGRFDHFAIDSKGQRLFVAALGNDSLEVIDLAAGKRVQSITGMSKPTGVLYLAWKDQVLVANGDDGALKVLSGTDYKVLLNLSGFPDADNLRFDPATRAVWLGYGEGGQAVFDTARMKPVASIKLPAHPESFQLEGVGNRVFVNVPGANEVAVVDRKARAVSMVWPMESFKYNFPMAYDEANHRLLIGCRDPARLVVVDTEATTGRRVADVEISADTDDLFYDAGRKRVYLSCGEGFIDTVEQISADSYKRTGRLPTAVGARTSFFSSALDRLYLAVPERGSQKAEIRVYTPE